MPILLNPNEPMNGESPYGYFRRLAMESDFINAAELARVIQQPVGRTAWFVNPALVSEALGIPIEWTQRMAKAEASLRAARGLRRNSHDAICPQCLQESAHMRAVWEHRFVSACHRHRRLLVDMCPSCGRPLSVQRSTFDACSCGHSLLTGDGVAATPGQQWVAAALECGDSGDFEGMPRITFKNPRAFEKLIKGLCLFTGTGYDRVERNTAQPLHAAQAAKFLSPIDDLLDDWPNKFEAHVRQRIEDGAAGARTLNTLLGAWYRHIQSAADDPGLELFQRVVVSVADATSRVTVGLDSSRRFAPEVTGFVSSANAARALRMSRDRVVRAVQQGALEGRQRSIGARGKVIEVGVSSLEALLEKRALWINAGDACDYLRVPESVLKGLIASGLVVHDDRWKEDATKGGPIERSSVVAIYDALKQFADPRRDTGRTVLTQHFLHRSSC